MVVERAVAAGPRANVLPGPSRTITAERVKIPAPPVPVPREPAPDVEPEPARRPDREPVAAR